MIRKIIATVLVLLLLLPASAGCQRTDDGKITVLCTVFPIYDWVKNVVGENDGVEVRLLVSNGTDIHSYQPTAADVFDIRSAEMIVRVGGSSDGFLDDILKKHPDGERIDLQLIDEEGVALRDVSSESVVGEGHAHTHECDHGHENVDEHIWLSIKNAAASVTAIYRALAEIDADGAEGYRARAEAYTEALSALDAEFSQAVASVSEPRVLFADRFPFVYLMEDYGVEYVAAFRGCTTEVDATFETVARLSDKLDEWELSCVSVTESSDGELAESVIAASASKSARFAVFDSMQATAQSEIDGGKTYVGTMKNNLEVLKDAISAS